MRLLINTLLAAGLLAFTAASASAVQVYVNPVQHSGADISNPLALSDTFTVQLVIESESANLDVVGTSVSWDPSVLAIQNIFAAGPCPSTGDRTCTITAGGLFGGSGSYGTLGKLSGPNALPTDPAGTIRLQAHAGIDGIESKYSTTYPPGNRVTALGYANFSAIGNGATAITPFLQGGDIVSAIVGGVGGQPLAVTFTGINVTVGAVPEPATALLVCLSLGGLVLAGRKLS